MSTATMTKPRNLTMLELADVAGCSRSKIQDRIKLGAIRPWAGTNTLPGGHRFEVSYDEAVRFLDDELRPWELRAARERLRSVVEAKPLDPPRAPAKEPEQQPPVPPSLSYRDLRDALTAIEGRANYMRRVHDRDRGPDDSPIFYLLADKFRELIASLQASGATHVRIDRKQSRDRVCIPRFQFQVSL